MDMQFGRPFTVRKLEDLKAFLRRLDLDYDENVQFTVECLDDDGEISIVKISSGWK